MRRAREKDNIDHSPSVEHPYLGRKFKRGGDDVLEITKVVIHWHAGYYYTAVYEINNSGSHGTVVIENINSINEIILKDLEDFKNNCKLTE